LSFAEANGAASNRMVVMKIMRFIFVYVGLRGQSEVELRAMQAWEADWQ
jgi:hypothetical protein